MCVIITAKVYERHFDVEHIWEFPLSIHSQGGKLKKLKRKSVFDKRVSSTSTLLWFYYWAGRARFVKCELKKIIWYFAWQWPVNMTSLWHYLVIRPDLALTFLLKLHKGTIQYRHSHIHVSSCGSQIHIMFRSIEMLFFTSLRRQAWKQSKEYFSIGSRCQCVHAVAYAT